jgi:hypothetical protein
MNNKNKKIKELEEIEKNRSLNESLQELNKVRSKITLEWGNKRIMQIISPELLLRFKRAKRKYDTEQYKTDNIELNKMMVRAYEALINDAINRGYSKLLPGFIYTVHPKTQDNIIICINEDDVAVAFNKYQSKEDVIIFHISEILISMKEDFIKLKKETHKIGGVISKYESINT